VRSEGRFAAGPFRLMNPLLALSDNSCALFASAIANLKAAGLLALNDDFAVLHVRVDLSNVKGAGATFSAALASQLKRA
jgi:hypothetical protein